MAESVVAVDLFCGVGGLTHGLQKSGIPVTLGIDNDSACEYAFTINNKAEFLEQDIRNINPKEIKKHFADAKIKILAGCAPCQTFSQHTKKNKDRAKDERWGLLHYFLDLVKTTQPNIVTMENVPQLRNYEVFDDFVKGLEKEGFFVSHKIIYCPRYGIPQKRSRLVLLASKLGQITLLPETHKQKNYTTIKKIIGALPKLKDGEICPNDPLHRTWKLSPRNKKRIKQSKPGGSWLDWEPSLRLACHKKETGSTYKAVYGRMQYDAPAPTITTQFYSYGTGRFGHPEQHRALSLREGALLQTFPKNYKFTHPEEEISFNVVGRHIGNAVPVKLGEIIGKSIKNHIHTIF